MNLFYKKRKEPAATFFVFLIVGKVRGGDEYSFPKQTHCGSAMERVAL